MDIHLIQEEVSKVQECWFAKKTDKQLQAYQDLSELYKGRNKGIQPIALSAYNSPSKRSCKLSVDQVREIRRKYNPHVYGKQKLAREYGVSTSVIYRILNGKSWNKMEDVMTSSRKKPSNR